MPQVNKPGQYLGNERGAWAKDWDSVKSRIALIYPDLYEIGMSNFGLKILYNIVNRHPDYLCDRSYAPMLDMERLLKERNLPLWGWETYKALGDFDMLGFSLAYELCYSNVFTVLDLPKIPFLSRDRDDTHPLIFAGGPAVFNPEPMAEYFDFFLIGDGEELILEIQEVFVRLTAGKTKVSGQTILRNEVLTELSKIQGIYVPQFYKPDPGDNYLPKPINNDLQFPILKRVTQELTDINQPVTGPIPNIQTVQDKQVLEIRRGCDRGCRFCQVGYTYLPVRERSPEDLYRLSQESIKESGYEDFTLLSLSASDYTCLTEAARAINNTHAENGVALSMPSQRADRFNVHLASEVTGARKSGMTFAPEAGTEKMRRIINKGLSETEIQNAIRNAYQEGWAHIKLYFMIGLPFEEDSDLDGILDILTWSINMARQVRKTNPQAYSRTMDIACTISTFVPKTFTAFQWFPQCSSAEFKRKHEYLKQGLRDRNIHRQVKLNCTEPEIALIESVLSRGDRRWGQVVESLWQEGARLDSWGEYFNMDRWRNAALKHGLDLEAEVSKDREPGSKQCWDVLSIGFTEKFLVHEWQQAEKAAETAPCTENKCHACGVCFNLEVVNLVTKNLSENNPFVTEIDKEKRQVSCADFTKLLGPEYTSQSEIIEAQKQESRQRNLSDSNDAKVTKSEMRKTHGPKLVVKHTKGIQKLRLQISKLDDLRFIGHLDFQRVVERALRRSGIPIVHTTGYNQRMKISWGTALPLFVESLGEYIEIELAEKFDNLENLKQILNHELPKQARIEKVEEVSPEDKILISEVLEAVYTARLVNNHLSADLSKAKITNTGKSGEGSSEGRSSQPFSEEQKTIQPERLKSFLNQDVIEVMVKNQSKDIKARIIDMQILDSSTIQMTLRATQRADEILRAFMPGSHWRICKNSQTLKSKAALQPA